MKTIWKFDISAQSEQIIRMPKGADILTVDVQEGLPRIWAKCDSEAIIETRTIFVYPTGAECLSDKSEYIGTFLIPNTMLGCLVFHVFEAQK